MPARVWGINTRYDSGERHPLTGRTVVNRRTTNDATIARFLREGKGLLLDREGPHHIAALADEFGKAVHHITSVVEHGPTMLVQPDGIVAWASLGTPDAVEARRAAAHWFALA